MIRLAIVEDEKLLLEDLANNVDWAAWGVEVAFTERNGANALKQLQHTSVDMILTDIRMPVMDGIELARRVQAWNRDPIQFIFLTSYDDVDYMKSAIELRAVAYLSKPFRMEELHRAVSEAICRRNMARSMEVGLRQQRMDQLTRLALEEDGDPQVFPGQWQLIHVEVARFMSLYRSGTAARVNQVIRDTREHLERFLSARCSQYVVAHMSKGQFLLLASGESDLSRMTESDEAELDEEMGRGIQLDLLFVPGNPLLTAEGFASRYRQLMQLREEAFYRQDRLPEAQGEHRRTAADCKRAMLQSVGTPERMRQALRRWMACISAERPDRDAVLADCYEVCKAFADARGVKGQAVDLREMLYQLEEQSDLGALEDYLLSVMEAAEGHTGKVGAHEEDLVDQMIAYINKHYAEPISAESMTKSFFLASNAIRALFKEKTGYTVHEYLMETRMRQAQQLLRDSTLRIKDVAERVGYDNVSYFCMRFSRTFDMTPMTYRRQILQKL